MADQQPIAGSSPLSVETLRNKSANQVQEELQNRSIEELAELRKSIESDGILNPEAKGALLEAVRGKYEELRKETDALHRAAEVEKFLNIDQAITEEMGAPTPLAPSTVPATTPAKEPLAASVTKPETPQKEEKKKAFIPRLVDGMKEKIPAIRDASIRTTDAILGRYANRLPPAAKTAVGIGLWLTGGVLLWKLGKAAVKRMRSANEAGKEAADAAKANGGGLFKRILFWGAAGTAAFFGGKWLVERYFKKQINAIEKKMGKGIDKATEAGRGFLNKLDKKDTNVEKNDNEPWKVYGLSEEEHEQAQDTYYSEVYLQPSKKADGLKNVRQIFTNANATEEQYEKFITDMDKEHEYIILDDVPNTHYVRPSVALRNYHQNIEIAVNQLLQWIKNNKIEAASIAYIAHRIGVDIALIKATRVTTGQALRIAKGIAKLGFNHPLASLFLMGSSALALLHLTRKSKNAFLPENLQQLFHVCINNQTIFHGDIPEAGREEILKLRTHAEKIGTMGADYADWISENIGDFTNALINDVGPEKLMLSEQERSEINNIAAMDELGLLLEGYIKFAETNTANISAERRKKYELAYKKFLAFRDSFQQKRCERFSSSTEPQELFSELQIALTDIELELTIKDGKAQWKTNDMDEPLHLCADPSIIDQTKFHEESENLYKGEGIATFALQRAAQQYRVFLHENSEKIPFGTKAIACVLGHGLHFIELDWKKGFIDWDHTMEYGKAFFVPFEAVYEGFDSNETWAEQLGRITDGFVTTAMFALSAEAVAFCKRLAIGGGKLGNPKLAQFARGRKFLFGNLPKFIPGVGQVKMGFDTYRGVKDFTIVGKKLKEAQSLLQVPKLWWHGRYINTILARAGLRPEWIPIIEHGNQSQLDNIMGKMGIYDAPQNMEVEEFRAWLKSQVHDRLNLARRRQLTLKNWGKRILWGGAGADADDIYRETVRLFDNTAKTTHTIDHATDAVKAKLTLATTETVVQQDEWSTVLKKFTGKVSIDDVDAFLKLAAEEGAITLDKNTLALIEQSPGAKKIIAGAVDTLDTGEIDRAMKAAKNAGTLRIGLNAAGAGADLFAVYMAYCDYQANGERIENAKNTGNKALAELYEQANYLYLAEGGEGTAGIAIGTVAIVKAYTGGQSLLTALGASGGLVMLPIGLATMGGGYVYRKAEKASETWLRTSEDWIRASTPGELLEKIKEIDPGNRGKGQGYGKATFGEQAWKKMSPWTSRKEYEQWEQEGEKRIEDANAQARYELTKAYIVNTTVLPREESESDEAYQKRFDQRVLDQMAYLTFVTQGTYPYQLSGYDMPRLHAELMEKSRMLKERGQSEFLTLSTDYDGNKTECNVADYADLSWEGDAGKLSKQEVLSKYAYRKKEQTVEQIGLMARLQQTGYTEARKRQAVKQQLILACIDDLYKLDGRIATADFYGHLGAEEAAEAHARATASALFQAAVERQCNRLLKKAGEHALNAQEYSNAIEEVRKTLGVRDPVYFQSYYAATDTVDPASARAFLSPQYQLNAIADEAARTQEAPTINRQEDSAWKSHYPQFQ